jgi:hypothetical protein
VRFGVHLKFKGLQYQNRKVVLKLKRKEPGQTAWIYWWQSQIILAYRAGFII